MLHTILLLVGLVGTLGDAPVCKSVSIQGGKVQMKEWANPALPRVFEANEAAHACFEDVIMTIGWSWLNMYGNPEIDDLDVARAAGYIEGYTTMKRIYQHSLNTGIHDSTLSEKVGEWVTSNNQYMDQMFADAAKSPDESSRTYWWQVQLIVTHVKGIYEGYSAAAKANKFNEMTFMQIWRMNFQSSFVTLDSALDEDFLNSMVPGKYESIVGSSHCSALIRSTEDDIFVSQVSWDQANGMMRIYKLYDFSFKLNPTSKERTVQRIAFASYPAMIYSGDDFYVSSAGLTIMETTIGNSNPELFRQYITPFSVLEGIRNQLANRLANTNAEWMAWYKRENDGTYNNQNMLVDFKLFEAGKPLKNDTFWVVEQLPGFVNGGDATWVLRRDGFFGSYNTPFFPSTNEESGNNAAIKRYGSWFDYWGTARHEIFKRNHTLVHDLESMKKLMRYNNFKHDPLSTQINTCDYIGWHNCTPWYTSENSISCRDDLDDPHGIYAIGAFGLRDHVGMDGKITSYKMYKADPHGLTQVMQSGPTYDQQPVFVFSKSAYANTSWVGLPDSWHFPWVSKSWN